MDKVIEQFANRELPYFGYTPKGMPLGDETGFRDIKPDENLESECDDLVEIGERLLTRPAYFEKGWTDDKRLFLREPALQQFIAYDRELQKILNWRVRIVDPFRPWTIQQKGFCWGISEVIRNKNHVTMDEFIALLKRCVEGKENEEKCRFVESYLMAGDEFFVYVQPQPYDRSRFPTSVSDLLIAGAANFGLIDLRLDPYNLTPHSSGGVADVEWIDLQTGKPVNVGVPFDTQGLEAAFPFFEDRVAPVLTNQLKKLGLENVTQRKDYYRSQVAVKPDLQKYLYDCGVDVVEMMASAELFDAVWETIKLNRRAVVLTAQQVGILFYGLESWHADCSDIFGGVHYKKTNVASGGPGYAIQFGQEQCSWGNATKLWEKKTG